MRVNSVKAVNFASYKELNFDFTNQGLTLIQGPTGAGKSTLCDLIPWTLFGRTAKGGTVAEVLTWPGDEVCKATLYLDNVTIHRARGPNAKDNDLMFWPVDGVVTRGKDLPDTQRLINQLLGMDYELYLSGAYYHEFSQTAQFFTATAKNRRTICEQLVDLTLAKTLQSKIAETLKLRSRALQGTLDLIREKQSNITLLERLQLSENGKASSWEVNHTLIKQASIAGYDRFEANRKKIISKKCNSCGTVLTQPKEVIDTSDNPFTARLAELEIEQNPHTGSIADYSSEIKSNKTDITMFQHAEADLKNEIEEYELLQQVTNDYRSLSITNTIKDIEYKTNQILTDYFDAECKVSFIVADADKLDVTIYKDGNVASYTQLSKGQRCLLKLAFGISVMEAVANHHGITFSQIFLDEALDGLDDNMKVKAYRLLETIVQGRESVFVVEHSKDLKACFGNSYEVELTSEGSIIAKA